MTRRLLYILLILYVPNVLLAQLCEITSQTLTHVNCFGEATGSIDITLSSPGADISWQGPSIDATNISNLNLSSLEAGNYIITIIEYDAGGQIICSNLDINGNPIDTIEIYQTNELNIEFNMLNRCKQSDSVDVITHITGGTPPYNFLWSTGDTSRNFENLPYSQNPYFLTVTDTNNCTNIFPLYTPVIEPMTSLIQIKRVKCKNDNNGAARVFVENGNPPFHFQWSIDTNIIIENDSFSFIESLIPGNYFVKITDQMGCVIYDTANILTNPDSCIVLYNVFSPNGDGIHDFWEINNIELYPEALIEVYDRNGRKVFFRRDYQNTYEIAFSGNDKDGNKLSSGVYYYVIDFNQEKTLKGVLTIIR